MTNPFTDVHDFPIRSSDGAHVHVAHAADGCTCVHTGGAVDPSTGRSEAASAISVSSCSVNQTGVTLGVDRDAADDANCGARTTLTPDEAITVALELLHCVADTLSPAELWDFGMNLDGTAAGFVDAARDRGHQPKGWLHS